MKEKLKKLSLADLKALYDYYKNEPSFREDPHYFIKLGLMLQEILERMYDMEILTNDDTIYLNGTNS
jgi:hypothetical protein